MNSGLWMMDVMQEVEYVHDWGSRFPVYLWYRVPQIHLKKVLVIF